MKILPGVCVSSPSPSSRHLKYSGFLRHLPPSDALLPRPEVVFGGPGSPGHLHSSPSGHTGSDQPHVGPSSSHASSSICLEDYWRLRSLAVSDASLCLISGSWLPSTAAWYNSVWRSFKDFLSACRVLLLSVVLEYLTHLADQDLAYRTIRLHRSVLSATLPPVDGHEIGHHPLISCLLRGVFQNRPPTRRFFASWIVASLFTVFLSPLPLDFVALQRKLAFLLAIASSRRPSEVALLCFAAVWRSLLSTPTVRFLPSQDRSPRSYGSPHSYLASSGVLWRQRFSLPRRLSKIVWNFGALGIPHNFLFSSPPFTPLSTTPFSELLRWAFRLANIDAPPGSTRHILDVLARGAGVSSFSFSR